MSGWYNIEFFYKQSLHFLLRKLATEWEDIMTINNWILIYIQENQHKLSYIQIRSPTLSSLSKKTELQLTKNPSIRFHHRNN